MGDRIYTVKYGDTLTGIASNKDVNVSSSTLKTNNYIINNTDICVGQELYIDKLKPYEKYENSVSILSFGTLSDNSVNPPLSDLQKEQYDTSIVKKYGDEFYQKYKGKFVLETSNSGDIFELKRSQIGVEIDTTWGVTNDSPLYSWNRGIPGPRWIFGDLINRKEIKDYTLIKLERKEPADFPFSAYVYYAEGTYYVLNSTDGEEYYNDYKGREIYIYTNIGNSNNTNTNTVFYNKTFFSEDYIPSNLIATWAFNNDNTKEYQVILYGYKNETYEEIDTKTISHQSGTYVYKYTRNADIINDLEYTNYKINIVPIAKNSEFTGQVVEQTSNNSSASSESDTDIEEVIPEKPTITIDGKTVECFVENVSEIADYVYFEVVNIEDSTDIYSGRIRRYNIAEQKKNWKCSEKVKCNCAYKTRCRFTSGSGENELYSKWSEYSDIVVSAPDIPIIKRLTPNSTSSGTSESGRSVEVEWTAAYNKTKYTIEYVKKDMILYGTIENHFWALNSTKTSVEVEFDKKGDAQYNQDTKTMTKTIVGLEDGAEYYIRMKGTNTTSSFLSSSSSMTSNSASSTSDWSEIYSFILGSKPTAPTAWSSSTTAIVGEPLNLYWLHNSADNSKMSKSKLYLYNKDKIYKIVESDTTIEGICNRVNEDFQYKGELESIPTDLTDYSKGDIIVVSDMEYILSEDDSGKQFVEYGYKGDHVLFIDDIVKINGAKNIDLETKEVHIIDGIAYERLSTPTTLSKKVTLDKLTGNVTGDNDFADYYISLPKSSYVFGENGVTWLYGYNEGSGGYTLVSHTPVQYGDQEANAVYNYSPNGSTSFPQNVSVSINQTDGTLSGSYTKLVSYSNIVQANSYSFLSFDWKDNIVMYELGDHDMYDESLYTYTATYTQIYEKVTPNKNVLYIDLEDPDNKRYIYNGSSLEYAYKDIFEVGRELYLWFYSIEILNDAIDNMILSVPSFEPYKDTIRICNIKTSYFGEGKKILWMVQTAGISGEYSPLSELKEINIYSQPEVDLTLDNQNHEDLDIFNNFPIYLSAKRKNNPLNQQAISFYINIVSEDNYTIVDSSGNEKNISKGDVIYSNSFDVDSISSPDEDKFKVEGFLYNGEFYLDSSHSEDSKIKEPQEGMMYIDLHNNNQKYRYNSTSSSYVAISDFLISDGDKEYPYYYPYYSKQNEKLYLKLTCSDLDLNDGSSYTAKCSMVMDSGLTGDAEYKFIAQISGTPYSPYANITIDKNNISAIIEPRCTYTYEVVSGYYNETDSKFYSDLECTQEIPGNQYKVYADMASGKYYIYKQVSDILYDFVETADPENDSILSVYRKELDGTFTEIDSNIESGTGYYAEDPHPSLNYAVYRIVSESISTGLISYTDTEPILVGEEAIIIQFGSTTLRLPYNIDTSSSYSPDVSLVEYIGRKHPVSYYGTQLGESASWNVEIPKYDTETLNTIRKLAIWMDDVYVREPSGTGYWANIIVSFTQTHCELTIPISFNISRVEGGK
ncbi:MAG: LysM peptidoglycan-binding domain-containing protein [Anaeroplasma sp.]